jgi:serine/threonine protein kinase
MIKSIPLNSVIGEYRLVEKIGAGGMGEVYRAVHSKIGRMVALKVLNQTVQGQEFVERFLNEARIQASLHHQNIATLYDFLEFNGQPCIIMEYVEGDTIADRIAARGAMPLADAVAIFKAVLDAIHYIHSQGIVHRDIKSHNVKISTAGQVKLLDFGIAKSGSSPALTMTGGFVGTLQYLSPEQFTGGIADTRSDIWALGVLLYEMVTGRMPFEASTIGSLYEKINAAAFVPPSAYSQYVPREIEAIIARCLRRNPAERYQSAWEMSQDLNRMGAAVATITAPPAYQNTGPAYPAPAPAYPTAPSPPVQTSPNPYGLGAQTAPAAVRPKKAWPFVAIGAVMLLAIIGIGGYALLGGSGASVDPVRPPGPQPSPSRLAGNTPQVRTVTIEVTEGRADVYKDGQKVGSTPYKFDAPIGERANFVLKREGYVDRSVELSVTDSNRPYTYTMHKKE